MKKPIYFLALVMPIMFFAFRMASTPQDSECTCGAPTNVVKTEVTRSSVTFDWDDVQNANLYLLTAKKIGTKQTAHYTSSASTFTFEILTSGTYEFTFTTDCNGELSQSIVISDVVF